LQRSAVNPPKRRLTRAPSPPRRPSAPPRPCCSP
jgi:hypothetical protein